MSECKKILCPNKKKSETVSSCRLPTRENGFGFFYLVGSLQEETVSDFFILWAAYKRKRFRIFLSCGQPTRGDGFGFFYLLVVGCPQD